LLFILFALFPYGSSLWLDAWAFCWARSGFDVFCTILDLLALP
jgi:hypothetical protein